MELNLFEVQNIFIQEDWFDELWQIMNYFIQAWIV